MSERSVPIPPAVGEPPRLDGFRYVSPLGGDEHAALYLYEQAVPRRFVVLRVWLTPLTTRSQQDRFLHGGKLLAAVSAHPFLVSVFAVDVASDGRAFAVMDYYTRPHLGARVAKGPLPVSDVLRIGIQVAGGVDSAHRVGLLHSDIKPANILMSAHGWPGLTGFPKPGSSRAWTDEAGPAGAEPEWMAPELFEPYREPDRSCDVYSLGATLWHLLVGRSPFNVPGADNRPVMMMPRIQNDALPALLRSDVPSSLRLALEHAMDKDPASRFASVYDLALALQVVQADMQLDTTAITIHEVDANAPMPAKAAPSIVAAPPSTGASVPEGPSPVVTQLPPELASPAPPAPRMSPPAHSDLIRAVPPSLAAISDEGDTHSGHPDSPRGRGLGLGLSAAVVAVAVVLALLWFTSERGDGDGAAPSRSAVPQDVVAGSFVPPIEGKATRVARDGVRFEWEATDQQPGDIYLVTRTDSGAGPRVSRARQLAASYELRGTEATRPCIDVVLVRASGRMSDPAAICSPS